MTKARLPAGAPSWTEPADVLARLRRRWDRGELLRAHAHGRPWEPVSLPLRGPTPSELTSRLSDARAWAARWRAASPTVLRLESRTVGGRLVGSNEVPDRVWVDSPDAMWRLLGVGSEVQLYDTLRQATADRVPDLVGWTRDHPLLVLAHRETWDRALGVVLWIADHDGDPPYLRQVDVPGVDTKFLETHRALLGELLDAVLAPDRVDRTAPRGDLVGRFGLRRKPAVVRLRSLDAARPLPGGFTELTVRVDELDQPSGVGRVVVVENEVTFLALPDLPGTAAILGGGYGLGRLAGLAWLADVELLYWGDLDTHGFAILDGLRAHFRQTRSILMDRRTLLAHEAHWGREPQQARSALARLTAGEAELFADLLADAFGPNVRLEQERIRFSWVRDALRAAAG